MEDLVVSALDDILTDVRDTAIERVPYGHGFAPQRAIVEGEDRALAGVAMDRIDTREPEEFLDTLSDARAAGAIPVPEVLIAPMGVVAPAANLAGATDTAVDAAREHGRATSTVACAAGNGPFVTLASRSLTLADITVLEDTGPDLVDQLHLKAGNRYMRPSGPTEERLHAGLRSFTAEYRLMLRAGSPDADRLGDTIRRAAASTVKMAQRWLRSLTRGEAGVLIDALSTDVPETLIPVEKAPLVLPPGELPFRHSDYFGAFACFGTAPIQSVPYPTAQ
jgi:hypothetical protein